MNITLALLLLAQPTRNWACPMPLPTFQLMLDSAYIVVIAKVDSTWYSTDECGNPWTNYSAEILALYTKNDSLTLPSGSIHIAYEGGVCADGSVVEILPSVSFEKGEVFLAAVEKNRFLRSKTELIWQLSMMNWKYTIANDSLQLKFPTVEPSALSLDDAINALSTHFIKAEQ